MKENTLILILLLSLQAVVTAQVLRAYCRSVPERADCVEHFQLALFPEIFIQDLHALYDRLKASFNFPLIPFTP
jgi:hypothetical protein